MRISPPYTLPSDVNFENDYVGHNGGGLNDGSGDGLSDSACDVTRVRLVQFQRNTDEPLVRIHFERKNARGKIVVLGYYTSNDGK